jgi:uncharacterized protein (DUF2252 family)
MSEEISTAAQLPRSVPRGQATLPRYWACSCDGTSRIRELLPQDLKIEIDRLTTKQAMNAASFLAGVVGKAHARQMDKATRQRWMKELERHRSKTLDAPGWLWSSVVALIGKHEVAYLEHCRRYASENAAA